MKAAKVIGYGSADNVTLTEVQRPEPGLNDILVRVHASTVTQADVMMRKGEPKFGRLFIGLSRPKNPFSGTGFAGKVVAVGAGVTKFAVGDDVFGETALDGGAHAEYLAVPEDAVVAHIPASMSYEEAAPVCDGHLTAHNFLTNMVDLEPGTKILINGASGAVGLAAVQIARAKGCDVTAVCSGRNADLVLANGADRTIDYTTKDFTNGAERYDVIFDAVGAVRFSKARRVLTANGTYLTPVLTIGILGQMLRTSLMGGKKAKFSATGALPHDQLSMALAEIISMIDAGQLTSHIDRSWPLARIGEAHAYVETGRKRGNVTLVMDHPVSLRHAA